MKTQEIKKVISFSGGRTSAYLVHLFKSDPNAHFVFMDTGAEHPATYQFIQEVVKYWGIDLICLRVVINPQLGKGGDYRILGLDELEQDLQPWKDMLAKYGAPAYDMAYCTGRMKTEPFKKYCTEKFGKGNYQTWIGIRSDEPKRLPIEVLKLLGLPVHQNAVKRKPQMNYLAEISDFDKQDILNWWKKQPFDLSIPEHLGNCVFCIKKSLKKIALAEKDEAQMAIKWIDLTEGDYVRTHGRKHNHKRMYRDRLHMSDVIEIFKGYSRNQIFNSLRSTKQFDTNSCSESCEAIS